MQTPLTIMTNRLMFGSVHAQILSGSDQVFIPVSHDLGPVRLIMRHGNPVTPAMAVQLFGTPGDPSRP